MGHLSALNKYFVKYKWRLLLGLLFVIISNWFAVLAPNIVGKVLDEVQQALKDHPQMSAAIRKGVMSMVVRSGFILLGLALLRGIFMFFMRQTIIVMSRFIEYDQKNEIYNHYQELHTHFFKTHYTGDMMNRVSEDVSRVRMYTGPSIMYATNLVALTVLCVWNMIRISPMLTLFVVLPLPLLAATIYFVNKIIHRKSEQIQAQLSDLTTTAQESYSGIRVIRSFVQEKNMEGFFEERSEQYRKSAINLSLTEAIYFPSMNLFIGLSMLSTVLIGGYFAMQGKVTAGDIAAFVIYINLLMFPMSSIGWVASMVQRASASQKRINEFLHVEPEIRGGSVDVFDAGFKAGLRFSHLSFTYPHTGIKALKSFDLDIKAGDKVAIIGKTGSGKSTLAHLLLRMYDPQEGSVLLDGVDVKDYSLKALRSQIAYAPQDSFLFSDTVFNNIRFGDDKATEAEVKEAARLADVDKDIRQLAKGYDTVVGERGVMLSGGQKQRIVLARALLKKSRLLLLDECLSAVDTQTEKRILSNLEKALKDTTVIVITHRLFTSWEFDKIIVMEDGRIAEQGTHEALMALGGQYARLYLHQTAMTEG